MLGIGEIRHRIRWPKPRTRWLLLVIGALLIAAGLQLLPGLDAAGDTVGENEHAQLEPVEGTSLSRVRLSPEAAERLDIQTVPVGEAGVAGSTVIPYSAVLYDAEGETWVYTNPEPLVFLRAPIEVDRIEGASALLLDGPPPGVAVVSVGAAELFGAEFGVGH